MARTPDVDFFLKQLPKDGASIGNKSLREKLKWEEDKYWRVRDEILEAGIIKKGTGKGGSVALLEKEKPVADTSFKDPYKDEKALYSDFLETIELKFTKDERLKNYHCEDVSTQGRKNTGGLWTRPDIVLVSINSYSYYPVKVMDLISFELKHYKNISIAGVFETASHSRFATKSYFCLYIPRELQGDFSSDLQRIKPECERFGIGLLVFSNPKDYDTFDIVAEPTRRTPDPADMDEFIRIQISEKGKTKISELLR